MSDQSRKRPGSFSSEGGPDSKKFKSDEPDKNDVAAMVAAKRLEIQRKLEMMKKSGTIPSNANVTHVPMPSQAATSGFVRPPPPGSGSAPPATSSIVSQEELRRKIMEAKEKVRMQMMNMSKSGSGSSTAGMNGPTGGAASSSTAKGSGLQVQAHPSLVMDETGKWDFKSTTLLIPKSNFATTKANQRLAQQMAKKVEAAQEKKLEKERKEIEASEAEMRDPSKNPYFDPKLAAGSVKARAPRALKFHQKGKFVAIANKMRADAHVEKLKKQIEEAAKKTGMASELDLVSDAAIRKEPPPPCEWWDAQLLPNKTYTDYDEGLVNLDTEKGSVVTLYIQHPVPIQPPAEPDSAPAPKPLMLTKKERKKLRRQRRLEAAKEKQERIRLGLLPPEQPKVKISNLMRVLGTEAVLDPTKIEAEVRKQMEARLAAHKLHNESKKLTEEEKKEKYMRKFQDEGSKVTHVAVYKVLDLSHPQKKYKVDINAQQLGLTGIVILHPGCNAVIVEGSAKALKFYKKLMLRRIDWSDSRNKDEDDDDEEDTTAANNGDGSKPKNECYLVWEGEVAEPSFNSFKYRLCPTDYKVREVLERAKVLHYWDFVKNYVSETAL